MTQKAIMGVVGGAFAGHKLQDGISDWKDKRDEEKEKEKEKEKQNFPPPQQPQQHRDNNSNVNFLGGFSGSCRDIRLDPSGGEYLLHASCKRRDGSYQASSISLNRFLQNDMGSFRWVDPHRSKSRHDEPPRHHHQHQERTVTVQPGDTLRGIAAQTGGIFEEIARINGIQNPDLIYPGQVLKVPGGSPGGGCHGGHHQEREERREDVAGNFGASARNVRLVDGGRRLEAELLRDGRWVGSSICLDERVGNDNGTLTFKS